MAKKKAEKPMAAQAEPATRTKPVRLELSLEDHERLTRQARKRGLSNASYARMVMLERLEQDEASKK
jgi:hypothetical protein